MTLVVFKCVIEIVCNCEIIRLLGTIQVVYYLSSGLSLMLCCFSVCLYFIYYVSSGLSVMLCRFFCLLIFISFLLLLSQ